jgi:hypothetical protein
MENWVGEFPKVYFPRHKPCKVDIQENYIEAVVVIILQGLPYMVGLANGSLTKYAMVQP